MNATKAKDRPASNATLFSLTVIHPPQTINQMPLTAAYYSEQLEKITQEWADQIKKNTEKMGPASLAEARDLREQNRAIAEKINEVNSVRWGLV